MREFLERRREEMADEYFATANQIYRFAQGFMFETGNWHGVMMGCARACELGQIGSMLLHNPSLITKGSLTEGRRVEAANGVDMLHRTLGIDPILDRKITGVILPSEHYSAKDAQMALRHTDEVLSLLDPKRTRDADLTNESENVADYNATPSLAPNRVMAMYR